MAYGIQIAKQARKYIENLDRKQRERLTSELRELAKDPLLNSKPVMGSPPKRTFRVGGLRVIFTIVDRIIIVTMIRPRGEVYDRA
jgi:mRNA-degrading endonuclease RelE of RelBE toxin-antitoxin system